MGTAVASLGLLIAASSLFAARTTPADLPEVQAIYSVAAILGLILMALGLILRRMDREPGSR